MNSLANTIWTCWWAMCLLSTITYGIAGDYPIMAASAVKSLIIAWGIEKLR